MKMPNIKGILHKVNPLKNHKEWSRKHWVGFGASLPFVLVFLVVALAVAIVLVVAGLGLATAALPAAAAAYLLYEVLNAALGAFWRIITFRSVRSFLRILHQTVAGHAKVATASRRAKLGPAQGW